MKRVLFVDDEPLVLQALQRMLRSMRSEWEMTFAESAARGLELMMTAPFDVVVSDMRMPGMDGAVFLNEVKNRHPRTVRLALSGHADADLVMRCVGATHQFLAKPCEPELLKSVIRRALRLEQVLVAPSLRQLTARLEHLPSVPSIYAELLRALGDPQISSRQVAEIVGRDIAMTAEILKLVNSAFFGLSQPIQSPFDAVEHLGLEVLRSLVLVVHAFSEYRNVPIGGVQLQTLWQHSQTTASLARRISLAEKLGTQISEEAFVAALLHDVGKLVLAANLPELYTRVIETSTLRHAPLCEVETQILGATHAEVGGYIMGLWGLPVSLVEAITLHHEPSRSQTSAFSSLTAVHVADWLVHQSKLASPIPHGSSLDEQHLKAIGLEHRLPAWTHLSTIDTRPNSSS